MVAEDDVWPTVLIQVGYRVAVGPDRRQFGAIGNGVVPGAISPVDVTINVVDKAGGAIGSVTVAEDDVQMAVAVQIAHRVGGCSNGRQGRAIRSGKRSAGDTSTLPPVDIAVLNVIR